MDDLRRRISYNPVAGGPNPNVNVVGGDASTGLEGVQTPTNNTVWQRDASGKLVRVK